MKAIRFQEFGEPAEVLGLEDLPVPEPERGQLRVRMLASPINPSDLMTVRGIYGKLPELPATPGYEGVGVVEHSGGGLASKLLRLGPGRRVVVLNSTTGNWAEQAIVPVGQVIPVPADLSTEQAATLFINPVTAWVMVRQVLKVPRGEWLLQTAAGSQLGRMVIRLGRQMGFRTISVVRRDAQVEELTKLGSDAVLSFHADEQEAEELSRLVREITGRSGVRHALDPVGGPLGSAVVGCLAPGGRLLCYGTLDERPLSFSPRELMSSSARIEGFWLARWLAGQGLLTKIKTFRTVTRLISQGVLSSEIGETFGLEEITAAVTAAEAPGRDGKVLLRIAD